MTFEANHILRIHVMLYKIYKIEHDRIVQFFGTCRVYDARKHVFHLLSVVSLNVLNLNGIV